MTKQPLELWGGVECTVNRVQDTYFDQLLRCTHPLTDLDQIAALGLRALRYPVLWERTAPDGLADWRWPDERLNRLRELGIRPIIGLVHHGSGPKDTSLIDPHFPEKLARYAAAVAARYPWIDAYTPVNEPLTTARFSGLYGYWYPHHREPLAYATMLMNQCRAVILAMGAIRHVNPTAQLIQTEDFGKTFSTPTLAYQAEHENHRRWLTFDLLCGRVDRSHPMWHYFRYLGVPLADLDWFNEHPLPPDIIGINTYLTSERFLDERTELYPNVPTGRNQFHEYVDVAAARVLENGISGPYGLLKEVWERYHLPIAVTEIHNGAARNEQMRWFMEFWEAAQRLRAEDVDLRALTSWALLGSHDWNTLVTQQNGHYEPGAFDTRGDGIRPTATARLLHDLAAGSEKRHPVLATPGWWRRPIRFEFGFQLSGDDREVQTVDRHDHYPADAPPVLIIGARGTLATAFAHICHERGLVYHLLSSHDMDITDPRSIQSVLERYQPWAVINTAGYVRVDQAEQDRAACFNVNTQGPTLLAKYCAQNGVQMLTFSSDLVFDGLKRQPYLESDPVNPLSVYGQSKAQAEASVLQLMPSALIMRTSAFFGPWDDDNFITVALQHLREGKIFEAASDVTVSPTYLPDLVHTSLDLLIDGEHGVWHLSNDGAVTWAELARKAAAMTGLDADRIKASPAKKMAWIAPRPFYSVLASERGMKLPSLESALSHFVDTKGWR